MDEMTGGKIRILMVLGNTGRGGAQSYAMNVLKNIDHTRFHIDFLVNSLRDNGYQTEMEQLGSSIHIVPQFKGINYFKYVRAVHEVLTQGNYDIVHGHASSTAALYLAAAKKHGCVTIVHSHSAGYRGNFAERIIKRLFTLGAKHQADYWFGCSELAAKRLFGSRYRQNPRYHDIPNAIITERYLHDENIRQNIRAALNIGHEDVLYGHVGSFSTPKNHVFLIQVFEEIWKTQGDKAHLILLGDGPLREKIEHEISKRGLQKQVILTGYVSNTNEYLMAMDAMIFPSLFEGFPVTLLEAQAAGLYSVVSDSITKEANITDCVVSMSLSESADEWAAVTQRIPVIDRKRANVLVSDTIFNMSNSIDKLMELYDEMGSKRTNG